MIENRITKLQLKKKIQKSLEWSKLCSLIELEKLPLRKERRLKQSHMEEFLQNAIHGKDHIRFHYVIDFDKVLSEIKMTIELYGSGI